jgi:NitT/TauT family transport system substrate-binding protein
MAFAAGSGAAAADAKLLVGFQPGLAALPAFVAKEEGFFAKRGLDVTLQQATGAAQISGVVSGSMQFGSPTVAQVLQGVENGLDLQFVAGANFLSDKAKELGPVIVRNGVKIDKPADFAGKTVGVQTIGAFLHVLFVRWLKENGVAPDAVTYVEISFPQMADVMKQGTIDAAVPVEPTTSRIVRAGIGHEAFNYIKDLPDGMPVLAYTGSRAWIAANRDTVAKFREALAEGMAFVAANHDKAFADANVYLKMPPAVMATMPTPDLRLDVKPEGLQQWVKLMKDQHLLKADLDVSKLIAH